MSDKTKNPPTIEQQKKLAGQMSVDDWAFLCRDPEFLDATMNNLDRFIEIASKRLNKKLTV